MQHILLNMSVARIMLTMFINITLNLWKWSIHDWNRIGATMNGYEIREKNSSVIIEAQKKNIMKIMVYAIPGLSFIRQVQR